MLLHGFDSLYISVCRRTALPHQALPGCPPHFFSLLKQFICAEPEEKISLAKVCFNMSSEEKNVL